MKKALLLSLCVVASGIANATLNLNPGDAALLPVEDYTTGNGILATRFENFEVRDAFNNITATGILASQVQRDLDGTLTFLYAVENDSTSADDIVRLTVNGFAGFLTSVAQDTNSAFGPQEATSVDRSNSGNTIGFSFTAQSLGLGTIAPGEASEVMYIRTNATDFTDGSANIIDGGVDTVLSYAPVPEPATMTLLGLGAAALIKRRRKA